MDIMMRNIKRYLLTDLKNIGRDDMLCYFIMIPVIVAVASKFLMTDLEGILIGQNVDVREYLPVICTFFFVIIPPAIIGFAYGFMWIDERDLKIITVFQVIPVSFRRMVITRMIISLVIGFLLQIIVIPLSDTSNIPLPQLLSTAALSSLNAPLFALFIFDFAKNKIEGFALCKYLYVLYMIPFVCYFIEMKYDILFGIIPTYWCLKYYWLAEKGIEHTALYYWVGVIYNILLVLLLLKRYMKVSYHTI